MIYSNYYFALPKLCYPKKVKHQTDIKRSFRPRMNVLTDENQVVLEFSLAGVRKEDLKLQVDNRMLILEAERKAQHEEKNHKHTEFGSVVFKTRIQLHEDLLVESLKAEFTNGVLQIRIAKNHKQKTTIEIK